MSTVSSKGAHLTRERLVESHLPLVHSVAHRYAGRGESLDDLVQVGAVGLVKAGNRFDESRGVAFATFAAPVIEGEIRRHLRDRSSLMRIPRALQRASGELHRQRAQLTAASGHSPSMGELAAALGTDEGGVERALRAGLARNAVPFPPDDESLERLDGSEQQGISSEDRLSLAGCMRALDERERTIVFLRFHADMTERQIGGELGISQAHVSRLLSGALARLRAELAGSNGDGSDCDTAVHGVISPASGGTPTRDETPKIEQTRTKERQRAATIGGVSASQDTLTLAHYLELPYTVAVHGEPDGERSSWNATVEELPGCAAQGRTPDEAVELLRGAMENWLAAALAQGREIPMPGGRTAKQRAQSSHSGRFLVRMPGALHAQLARAAEREQLSLNRFVTNVLAASVSPATVIQPGAAGQAPDETIERQGRSKGKPSRAFRVALATNLAVVVLAGLAAIVLLVLALQSGI
jgi:RNA polymerase sigma-B factor